MKKVFLTANTDWYLYRFRLSLAGELQRLGFEPVFVSPPGVYVSRIQSEGYRWLPWYIERRGLSPWKEIYTIAQFYAILNREKPDLIHNHTIKPVFYGSLTAQLKGYKNVINAITGRGYLFINPPFSVRVLRNMVLPLYRVATDNASFLTLFENESDLDFFTAQKMFLHTRKAVIQGVGVDTDLFCPQPEEETSPIVAYVGRLLWDKGVGDFVKSAEILKNKSDIRFVLIGNPDPGNPSSIPQHVIRDWVEKGAVEWWGWQEDMPDIYRQCHIIVMPSHSEGLSTTILEAMSCGRAVIATDVPGCRDLVHHRQTGLLIQPGNPQELAAAIQLLVEDPGLRRSLAAAGRQMILENYSVQHINQLTLGIYRQVFG